MKQITKEIALEAVKKANFSLNSFFEQECVKKFSIHPSNEDYSSYEFLFKYSGRYGKEFILRKDGKIFSTEKRIFNPVYDSDLKEEERKLICQELNFSYTEFEKLYEERKKLEQERDDSFNISYLVDEAESLGLKIYQ